MADLFRPHIRVVASDPSRCALPAAGGTARSSLRPGRGAGPRPLRGRRRRRSTPPSTTRRRSPRTVEGRRNISRARRAIGRPSNILSSSIRCSETSDMHHFDYRAGALHADDVDLAKIAAAGRNALLLLFVGDDRAALPGLLGGLRRARRAGLLRDEGQFQSGGADDCWPASAPAWTSSPEGELRRARAAGVPASKITFSGVGKTRVRDRARARRGHFLLQCGIRARARRDFPHRLRQGQARAYLAARQSRRRRQDPRQDFDRPRRE